MGCEGEYRGGVCDGEKCVFYWRMPRMDIHLRTAWDLILAFKKRTILLGRQGLLERG